MPLDEYEAWVEANSIDADPLRSELPVRRARASSATRGVRIDRPLRLGALHAPSTSRRPASRLRRRLLGDRGRAARATRTGAWRRRGSPGASTPSCSRCRSSRSDDGLVRLRLPRRLHRPPQAAGARRRGVRAGRRTRTCGCSSRPRSSGPARAAAAAWSKPTSGSSCGSPTSPGTSTCAAIAACDVCITPSRWEGLGLPLYEAIAFGQPVITNDDPPMNEVVGDGVNGLLVPSLPRRTARSGIPAKRPDPDALTAAIERIADPELLRASSRAGRRAVAGGAPLGADGRAAARSSCSERAASGADCGRPRGVRARLQRPTIRLSRSRRTGRMPAARAARPCRTAHPTARSSRRRLPPNGTSEPQKASGAGPAAARIRAGPPSVPGAVRGRRQPLRHDAAADDARRPSGADDAAGDPLRPRADRGRRGRRGDAGGAARDDHQPARVGRLRAHRGAAAGRSSRAIEPLNAGDALRAFYRLYAERVGKPRWGEKTPIYVKSIRKIERGAPGGALRPRDPRRPRRRPLDPRPRGQGAPDRQDRRALGAADRPGPATRPSTSPTTSRSATSSLILDTRADAASGSASSSSSPGTTRCSTTTSAPPSASRR